MKEVLKKVMMKEKEKILIDNIIKAVQKRLEKKQIVSKKKMKKKMEKLEKLEKMEKIMKTMMRIRMKMS